MTVLVICAVEAERDAVVRNFGSASGIDVGQFGGVAVDTPAGELHAFSVGVGPVAAAIGTSVLLTSGPDYEMVASAGIAGGFRDRVAVGDVVLANLATYADLGVRVEAGFLSLRDMGIDQDSSLAFGDQRLIDRMQAARVLVGEVLTLSAMTGTEADADELARLGNPLGRATLERALGSADAFERRRAVSLLAPLPGSLLLLEHALADIDPDVRLSAAESLLRRAYRPYLKRNWAT